MKYVAKDLRNMGRTLHSKLKREHYINRLVVTRLPGAARSKGRLHAGQQVLRCAIGGGGVKRDKREGDHAAPAGSWRLLSGFYRPEKTRPKSRQLPMRPIRKNMGWCDDSTNPLYNRLIVKPFSRSHEDLWREDHLYDIVIVLDYNIHPRRKRRGSAIFVHCAREGFAATEGCVAVRYDDLRKLLPRLSNRTVLTIR
jgi:L,D-peptidoglycan transpeptidase YkuD (ErfK/YbiS/YcfS/YnhG family)